MDAETLRKSPNLPDGLSSPLQALWHAARGDWESAHALVQDDESEAAAWVHAHLHRQEGDPDNAAYWYRKAGKPVSQDALGDEWISIASAMALRE